ncbi:hypothetical protein SFRURICE_020087 [Spodoptera frugiperda]|nr:hypothetical protein SFRURICE_020087 [Spodoptera frugiperda]
MMTLKRYARKQRQPDVKISYKPDYRQSKVFTEEEETELAKYCERASKLHHGLNSSSVRRLAYQFAVENNKPADKISKWSFHQNFSENHYHRLRYEQKTKMGIKCPQSPIAMMMGYKI